MPLVLTIICLTIACFLQITWLSQLPFLTGSANLILLVSALLLMMYPRFLVFFSGFCYVLVIDSLFSAQSAHSIAYIISVFPLYWYYRYKEIKKIHLWTMCITISIVTMLYELSLASFFLWDKPVLLNFRLLAPFPALLLYHLAISAVLYPVLNYILSGFNYRKISFDTAPLRFGKKGF